MVAFTGTQRGLSYVLAVEGLEDIDFEAAPEKIEKWLSQAVNKTTTRYRTAASRAMREQIAFGARYLISGKGGRLTIPRAASPMNPEAIIRGRFEPTSLVRFVRGSKAQGRRNPRMQIKTGRTTQIGGSFIMNLKSGNQGLAIRLKPGEQLRNKRVSARSFTKSDRNLVLLYGPSVDQVFRSVREDIAPDAAEFLEREFLRLAETLV